MKKINNKEFYHKAIKEYGISAQGVHWNSKYTQYKRFEIITKLISKKIKDSTIIDAGCGFGEYYNYLSINNRIPKKYIGIDCEKNMIDIAKKRFPQEQFEVNDILKDQTLKGDYYICSGSMNILELDEIELFIKNCFENSSKGFVFNYLRNLTFTDVKEYEIIEICKKLTPDIKMRENYLDNDFTVFMAK